MCETWLGDGSEVEREIQDCCGAWGEGIFPQTIF